MITKFILTTTGVASTIKLEGLGSYHYHPETSIDLLERFTLDDIINDPTIQQSIDNGEITVVDENGDTITNTTYISGKVPIIDVDNFSPQSSYIGYGEINACNILRVITTNGSTYTNEWADGTQNFDKIWADRGTYTYL